MAHKFVHISVTPEPKTGYVAYKTGDERCKNCEHFEAKGNECNGPKMKAMSQQPRAADGNVKVSPTGWCRFWETKEK